MYAEPERRRRHGALTVLISLGIVTCSCLCFFSATFVRFVVLCCFHSKFGPLFPKKVSCDRVALPQPTKYSKHWWNVLTYICLQGQYYFYADVGSLTCARLQHTELRLFVSSEGLNSWNLPPWNYSRGRVRLVSKPGSEPPTCQFYGLTNPLAKLPSEIVPNNNIDGKLQCWLNLEFWRLGRPLPDCKDLIVKS